MTTHGRLLTAGIARQRRHREPDEERDRTQVKAEREGEPDEASTRHGAPPAAVHGAWGERRAMSHPVCPCRQERVGTPIASLSKNADVKAVRVFLSGP